MKQLIYAVMFVIASLSLSTFAKPPEPTALPASQAGASASKTEVELREIINNLMEANLRGDGKVYAKILADTYTSTDNEGNIHTKAEILKELQPMPASLKFV
ncbi:MAG TPA: nuclear transport factor 2 family protein [Blastocatellia bacterium]|nr:nuclear transport factor 2 family protein [Blastocatellia bacterium]